MAATQQVIPLSESPYICIDVDTDEEELVCAALAYYKHGHFNKEASVRVCDSNLVWTWEEFVDSFSMVFGDIALSKHVQAFDSPIQRLCPSYVASNLSSGLYTIGTMVDHSFWMTRH